MKYFSVPADFKNGTIDKYAELNDRYGDSKVLETYGQVTVGNSFESGRSLDQLPPIDYIDFMHYVDYSSKKGIGFNYTINAPHLGNKEFTEKGMRGIKGFLDDLYNAGVCSLTIALPSLVELIKSLGYDFNIKSSVICQIVNANKAISHRKMGVGRLVIDESLNRNFAELKRITDAFGGGAEVIVNSICHKDCIYRMFHYNQIATDSVKPTNEISTTYYPHRCVIKRYEDISSIMKLSWIRPEDLKYYMAVGINHFKLQGRHTVLKGDPARAVECYFKESYDGNLFELLDMFSPTNKFITHVDNKKLDGYIKTFYEKEYFCKNDCERCNYCETFAKKSINMEQAEEVMNSAKNFYNQFDGYKGLIKQVKSGSEQVESAKTLEADFEFGG